MSVRSRIADYTPRHITRLLKLLFWRGLLLSCQKSLRLLRRHWLPLYVCSRYLSTLVGGIAPALLCTSLSSLARLSATGLLACTLSHVSTRLVAHTLVPQTTNIINACVEPTSSHSTPFALPLPRDCPGSANPPSTRLPYIMHGDNRPHAT